jgi:hypothetical protein
MPSEVLASEATVARRRKALNLQGSRTATRDTPTSTKRQLVLDQMAKDPTSRKGPRLIREAIMFDSGIPLTRFNFVPPLHGNQTEQLHHH